MVSTVQPDQHVPRDLQRESEYALARSTEGATKWDPVIVKSVAVAVIVLYLALASLLIAVAASAGTGG
ncbi:MAG TPA: hypothetical protein VHB98_17250 [Chloroflexota bacterium]|jgi:hypothetical protein|nr:hypothetical protein [Chloroflexota bacterium]